MNTVPQTGNTQAFRARLAALRAFFAARRSRVKGFGLLLFYCHMLMVFAFLGKLYLPDLSDLAATIGVNQAWRLEVAGKLESLAQNAIEGAGTVKADAGRLNDALKVPESLGEAKSLAAGLSGTIRDFETKGVISSWLVKVSGDPKNNAGDAATHPDQTTSSELADEAEWLAAKASSLPEVTALSGLPLSAKISSALVPLLFFLTTLSLFFVFFFKVSIWLGLGHIILTTILLTRAALTLKSAPALYLACLPESLQNFALGGFPFWLGGLGALAVLLGLTMFIARKTRDLPAA